MKIDLARKRLFTFRPCQPTEKLKLKHVRTAVLCKILVNIPYKTELRVRSVFQISKNWQNLKNQRSVFRALKTVTFSTQHTYKHHKKMRLSYDNLLLHLAQDYNNVLLHHTSFRSNYSHPNRSSFIERKKRKREEESKEHELREIEELIVVVLSL